jgi:hypothetical protein
VDFFEGLDFLWLSSISGDALNLTTSAKLAVSTAAEKIKLASLGNDTCMATATRNFGYLLFESKFSWLVKILFVSMAELAIVSVTPCKDLALICQQSGMLFTASEVRHLGYAMREVNLRRLIQLVGISSSHTKLTIPVCSPRVHLAFFVHAYGEVHATLNLHDIRQLLNLLGQRLLAPVAMTKRSILSESPGIYLTVFSHTGSMLRSASHLNNLLALQLSSNESDFILLGIVPWRVSSLSVELSFFLLVFLTLLLLGMAELAIIRVTPSHSTKKLIIKAGSVQFSVFSDRRHVYLAASYLFKGDTLSFNQGWENEVSGRR